MYLGRVNLHVMVFILCYTFPKFLLTQASARNNKNQNQHQQENRPSPSVSSSSSSSFSPHRVNKSRSSKMLHQRQRKDAEQSHHRPSNRVAYFYGHQIIRYSNLNLNFDHFTISLWIYVEGGEYQDSSILRLYNHCTFIQLTSLNLGVTTLKRKTMLYFSLRTNHSNVTTKLMSDTPIKFQRWTHVTISYDGQVMILYVDRAKIGVSHQQKSVFSSNVYPQCTTLDVGGNDQNQDFFRGALDKIAIINEAVSHRLISRRLFRHSKKLFVLREDFSLRSNLAYHAVHNLMPDLIEERVNPEQKEKVKLPVPKCGKTLCDNPEIVQSYLSNPDVYMFKKNVRYRVVLITKDDGSRCRISANDIHQKHKTLSRAFRKEKISLYLDIAKFTKTSLCNKTVLISCYRPCPDDSVDCRHAIPVDKVGCRRRCDRSQLGNGRCDIECNNPDNGHNWDRGDCCNSSITNTNETCYDPSSPNRAFVMESELKTNLNLTNSEAIVILPVQLPDHFLGKSTYPWKGNVYSSLGGITMNYKGFLPSGEDNNDVHDIIHELGHAFGLWHVHRGVSEVPCNSECAETVPSMVTGDLCSDTNPTPTNHECRDKVVHYHTCNGHNETVSYSNTPFKNYMGYATGSCVNRFTPQQRARMHCYLDSHYQRWQINSVPPSSIPVKPSLFGSTRNSNSVKLIWHPPVGYGKAYQENECKLCNPSEKYKTQYADKVYIRGKVYTSGTDLYSPAQILGPPNVEKQCSSDGRSWVHNSIAGEQPSHIEVLFKEAVIPIGLKFWITNDAEDAISDVVMLHKDGTTTSLGPIKAYCMEPYTTQISTKKQTKSLRIHLNTTTRNHRQNRPAIDAVQLKSERSQHGEMCQRCEKLQLRYRVYREPSFKGGRLFKNTRTNTFIDKGIERNTTYTYRVRVISGSQASRLSPPLVFHEPSGFCGNGIVEKNQRDEECDDGNTRNGDGCDAECHIESVFNCKMEPSLCYRYDRDGICEEDERKLETRDCGLYTPNGFIDQWAVKIHGKSGQSSQDCPENVMAGTPATNLKCVDGLSEVDVSTAWRPCNGFNPLTWEFFLDYWIEVTFERIVAPSAVIVHLSSDGRMDPTSPNDTIAVSLKSKVDRYLKVADKVELSCRSNPLFVEVAKDKRQFPVQSVRIEFTSSYLAIAAVGLRYPVPRQCRINQYFDGHTNQCLDRTQESPILCPKLNLQHSNLNCSKDGQQCKISCHLGYKRRNPSKQAVCDHGIWRNAEPCTPIDCGFPRIENAFVRNCNNTKFGDTCLFKCNTDSLKHGSHSKITCQKNGEWSKQQSFCVRYCSTDPTKLNMVSHDAQLPGCNYRFSKKYEMGTRCRLKCKQGYMPTRKPKAPSALSTNNIVNVFCNGQGEWSYDNRCEKIKCQQLSAYQKLLFSCTDGNRFESVCKTDCRQTKINYDVKCLASGEWSNSLNNVCKRDGTCEKLLQPTRSGVNFDACVDNTVGSRCLPSCGRSKDIVIKNDQQSFTHNGNEIAIYCMPDLSWSMSDISSSLGCEDKCFEKGIGDGICDCQNNRPHCQYDGEDCCMENVMFLPISTRTCKCIPQFRRRS